MGWIFIVAILFVILLYFIRRHGKEDDTEEIAQIRRDIRRHNLDRREKEEETKRLEKQAESENLAKERLLLRESTIKKYDDLYGTENSITCMVQGIFGRSKDAQARAGTLKLGEEVTLRPEPNNSYDPYAVKVLSNRMHIGYIPKKIAETVAECINSGPGYYAIVIHKEYVLSTYNWEYEREVELKLYLKPDPIVKKIQDCEKELDIATQNGDMETMTKLKKLLIKLQEKKK
ncbi:hypothetical protein E2605_18515 [Dysgonomonas capnocytophagoides]|uniref:HIRAN domain-containing protein n=1 Tax=Dysgonomonas capnocytophagoides TaxID=45254 RepID=A0A4Y8KX28_9BACT|nr:HIRAN domain-containing protein [Dysgonomonas capnocytophagoides]TFD92555.1 hypothetical protein E2605_18515 [Dysgonomonas capnocytophagoides]